MKEIIIAYDENTEASPIMGDWVGELVRCKNCKNYNIIRGMESFGWCEIYGRNYSGHWFCADGERKDSD